MKKYLWTLILLLLTACGAPTAEVELPTPTPLPPDPALERPTYTVTSGPIERAIEITARATPIDLVRLSFRREGRVNQLFFQRGDMVKEGDVLAELQQDEALDELRRATDDLAQARRDLEEARETLAKTIKERQLDVEQARTDLERLLPGGESDVLRAAQLKLEEAQRAARTTRDDRSWSKTSAEEALLGKAEALEDAQKAFSKAEWNVDWVRKYGTHPTERVPSADDPEKLIPRKLTDEEKEAFETALIQAERALRAAERSVEESQRALDKAREDEVVEIAKADEEVKKAQRAVDDLLNGKDSQELAAARRALDNAIIALEEVQEKGLNAEQRAVDTAQRALDRAQRQVDDGRVISPQAGEIIAINLEVGATVTAFDPIAEVADASKLEFAANLNGEQMRQLAEGQTAELRLLARPDVVIPVAIRRMPAPYGSGGSGAVQDRDQSTRFEVIDAMGQTFRAGASLAKVRIVLERKEEALLLPPEAVRAFEGRRFVIVREGDRERRVTVRVGITTEEQVEILEGLEEGDMVVGQ
jgi:HlyD family secretion protein